MSQDVSPTPGPERPAFLRCLTVSRAVPDPVHMQVGIVAPREARRRPGVTSLTYGLFMRSRKRTPNDRAAIDLRVVRLPADPARLEQIRAALVKLALVYLRAQPALPQPDSHDPGRSQGASPSGAA